MGKVHFGTVLKNGMIWKACRYQLLDRSLLASSPAFVTCGHCKRSYEFQKAERKAAKAAEVKA